MVQDKAQFSDAWGHCPVCGHKVALAEILLRALVFLNSEIVNDIVQVLPVPLRVVRIVCEIGCSLDLLDKSVTLVIQERRPDNAVLHPVCLIGEFDIVADFEYVSLSIYARHPDFVSCF